MRNGKVTVRSAVLALLFIAPPLAGAQTSAGTKSQARPIVVTGSSTVYPLMIDIGTRYFQIVGPVYGFFGAGMVSHV